MKKRNKKKTKNRYCGRYHGNKTNLKRTINSELTLADWQLKREQEAAAKLQEQVKQEQTTNESTTGQDTQPMV